jgi:hypothetical protein
MPIHNSIEYADIEDLFLDPDNPRLGRAAGAKKLGQLEIQKLMEDWDLEELAVSFLDSGFWVQEALIVHRELLNSRSVLVVVEGNRRLAALKALKQAADGAAAAPRWAVKLVAKSEPPEELFTRVPYIQADSRADVEGFLGFRHVTGIKEWRPAEKAEFIARLIEKRHLSYEQVMRRIGSKTNTVRNLYIAYRLLLQMEGEDNISIQHVEGKFSVLFLSLRSEGVRRYLGVDTTAAPRRARNPVPKKRKKHLARFALWMFGDEDTQALVRESRLVDQFGKILLSSEAVKYLERNDAPKFEVALQLAGGDEPELVRSIELSADYLELALGKIHRFTKAPGVRDAVKRVCGDALQLLVLFPKIKAELEAAA